jgi:predicted Co/Zn/Cd cation transporter (cation efflux family)
MRAIGLSMIGVAVAMFVLARPRHGKIIPLLRSDTRQWAYVVTIVVLIGVGFAISFLLPNEPLARHGV